MLLFSYILFIFVCVTGFLFVCIDPSFVRPRSCGPHEVFAPPRNPLSCVPLADNVLSAKFAIMMIGVGSSGIPQLGLRLGGEVRSCPAHVHGEVVPGVSDGVSRNVTFSRSHVSWLSAGSAVRCAYGTPLE